MAWLHPALGLLAVALVAWMAFSGLDSRKRRPEALEARRRHKRWTPWAAALCVLAALGGTASVVLLRPDMTLAETWHFRTGWACAALAVAAWLSSRGLHQAPARKALHPWVGILLLAAAMATAFLGIEHLP